MIDFASYGIVNNFPAEQYCLGCFLTDGELVKETVLREEAFFDERHRIIFHAMKELEQANKPIDITGIYSMLGTNAERAGGVEYLAQLSTSIPSMNLYKSYEEHVMNAWKVRSAANVCREFIAEASATSVDGISEIASKLSLIDEEGYASEVEMQEILAEMWDDFERDIPEGLTGVDTGYTDLNSFTDGFQKQDLIVVGARPSVGKTAFAINIAINTAKKGTVVPFFELEMSKKSLTKRMVSAEGYIDATKLRNPRALFTDDDWPKASMATSTISNIPIFIDDSPIATVASIRARVRKLKKRYPNEKFLVIIDYLQLLRGKGKNRQEEVAEISRSLKLMARDLDVPVVVLAQLSRGVEQRSDKRPLLSDLRESGTIEQDADVVILLYRDDYYDAESERKNIVEAIVAKQRNGPTGKIELVFLKHFGKFINLERNRA